MMWEIMWALVYITVGGFVGHWSYNSALNRCEYRDEDHAYIASGTYAECYHWNFAHFIGGVFWPLYGPTIVGRGLVSIFAHLPEIRHHAKLEKVRRKRELAEEQLRLAQINAERKRIEARATDDELRTLGLLGIMGENPYDR